MAAHTIGMTSIALPSGGEVSVIDAGSDDTAVPVSPAQDSGAPAREVPPQTPETPEEIGAPATTGRVAPPAAALDAYFTDEDTSTGQEVRTVETGDRGPALMASAGLVLGWIGLWRRDGAMLQPSAPRSRRRALNPARQRRD